MFPVLTQNVKRLWHVEFCHKSQVIICNKRHLLKLKYIPVHVLYVVHMTYV